MNIFFDFSEPFPRFRGGNYTKGKQLLTAKGKQLLKTKPLNKGGKQGSTLYTPSIALREKQREAIEETRERSRRHFGRTTQMSKLACPYVFL
jgi:hypothetical protein